MERSIKSIKMKRLCRYASDLGIATGIAFNKSGEMFVGDRSGTVYEVSSIRIPKAFCHA